VQALVVLLYVDATIVKLEALDSEWYAQDPSLDDLLLAYAKRRLDEFGER
jgi:hypothetical protein